MPFLTESPEALASAKKVILAKLLQLREKKLMKDPTAPQAQR